MQSSAWMKARAAGLSSLESGEWPPAVRMRILMSSGVSIDMSIAKELGDQSSDDAFSSVTSDLSDAVSGKLVQN